MKFWIVTGIVIAVLYGIGYLFLKFLASSLEYGFRNKYPLDYLRHISWVISAFEHSNYEKGEFINPGSNLPGIYMLRGDEKISILLKADKFPYEILCYNQDGDKIFHIKTKKNDSFIAEVDEEDKKKVLEIIDNL